MEDKIYLAALHKLIFNHEKLFCLIDVKKNTYKDIYKNLSSDILVSIGYKKIARIQEILDNYKKFNLKKLEEKINKENIEIISYYDENYPNQLKNIPNIPFVIYVKGKIPEGKNFGIVGSRKISSYGEKVIGKISIDLAPHFNIISGGAAGCDTKAHNEAIKNKTKTVVCLGTGIDLIYPSENRNLYNKIAYEDKGCLLSIFPIGCPGSTFTFPIRNEIIAGLSDGIIIIEAKEKSGSLITARLALELNKDLFAIPGEAFNINSAGTNALIKKGEAKLVTESKDILEEYGLEESKKGKVEIPAFSDELELNIFKNLLEKPFLADELVKKLNISIIEINGKLSKLELLGTIFKDKNGKYAIK
ncbi:MAG: DNA-processing protein DprA [Candidatus Gracilibacteria bacterium]|nr:DNA-processing protein DprA [Candidatus Gracilibacteria bacterium]